MGPRSRLTDTRGMAIVISELSELSDYKSILTRDSIGPIENGPH